MALTRLQAVNRILAGASEQPVSTLVDDGVNDTSLAEQILDETTTEVQIQGFGVSQEDKTFNIDTNGHIILSSNILVADPIDEDWGRALVRIGNKLYDADSSTFVFEESVRLRVTMQRDFEDLPPAIQFYVADMAARRYQQQTLASPEADAVLREREVKSMAAAKQADARIRNASWIHNPYSRSGTAVYRRRRI